MNCWCFVGQDIGMPCLGPLLQFFSQNWNQSAGQDWISSESQLRKDLLLSLSGFWQDSVSCILSSWASQLFPWCHLKAPVSLLPSGLLYLAVYFIRASKSQQKVSVSKMEGTILGNIIMEITACDLYHIVLVSNKSQLPTTFQERGLYKFLNNRSQG